MKLTVLAAALVAAVFTFPVAATETAAPEPAAAKKSPDDKICTVEKSTGSNLKKRVCRTRAQMEAERIDTRDVLERSQQYGTAER